MKIYPTVRPSLSEQALDSVIAAARNRAAHLGGGFTIVVVDDAAQFRALWRMDGADMLTVGLAAGKARLAAANGMPTSLWRGILAADPHLASTLPTALDRILDGAVLLGGGYPIRVDDHTVGGIGVSGGTELEDADVARNGLIAFAGAEQFTDTNAVGPDSA
jgi:uncharacterized protein GlcG (DUF336 family)